MGVISRISKDKPRLTSTEINKELQEHHGIMVIFYCSKLYIGIFWLVNLVCDCEALSPCGGILRTKSRQETTQLREEQEGASHVGEGLSTLDSTAVVEGTLE